MNMCMKGYLNLQYCMVCMLLNEDSCLSALENIHNI